MVVGLLGTFTMNTVILPIPLYIYVSSSLRKYIAFMMTVILKIFCGTEKYWQSQLFKNVNGMIYDLWFIWYRYMIYTLLKEKVAENTNLVTFSYILLPTYIYCS